MDATKARSVAARLRVRHAMQSGMNGIAIATVREDLLTIARALESGKDSATIKTECSERNYLFNYLCKQVEDAGIELVIGNKPGEVFLVDPDDEGLELRLEPGIVSDEEELQQDYGLGM